MSFLDDLKKEAEEKQAKEAQAANQAEDRERYLREVLDPTMNRLFHFCHDLSRDLNYVKPDIKVSYTLPGVKGVQEFKQGEYFTEDYHEGHFTFRCICRNDQKYRVLTNNEPDLQKIKDFLWMHGLRYQSREYFDERYTKCGEFFIEGRVQIDFLFTARPDNKSIELKIVNYKEFASFTFSISPDDVDDTFQDEFARYVVRQPNKFNDYNRYKFTEEQRRQLRQQLQGQEVPGAEGQAESAKSSSASLLGGLFRRKK
ncbi:MAG TPA: hypothetical protein VIX81_13360 [Gammaproteobacteria bacterium]